MAVVSGDCREITYNHPTKGSGTFFPKAGESANLDLGGLRTNDEAQGVDMGGRTIRKLTMNRWSFESVISNDMNITMEAEKLNELAGDPEEATWTFTFTNGSVYSAVGGPVGDVKADTAEGTIALKLAGGLKAEKVV